MKGILRRSLRHLSNLPGWRTSRKIVVFESDDWGSIRMNSKKAFDELLKRGVDVARSPYCQYDSLESNDDLELLFNALVKFRDVYGNHPIFTALTIVANPDFDKIGKHNFEQYFNEPVTETIKHYPRHDRVVKLWSDGIDSNIYLPQFHGREHLNVHRWMDDLRRNVKPTRAAFQNLVTGIGPDIALEIGRSYQAAFDYDKNEELDFLRQVLNEGLDLFRSLFGYKARYFVPTNGPFPSQLERILSEREIDYINTAKKHIQPLGDGRYKTSFRSLGMTNGFNQIYITRNGAFEPTLYGDNAVELCLQDIHSAFLLQKPAVISTHRLNYIGFIHLSNRDRGLKALQQLLTQLLLRWPETEFMTSVQLGDLIRDNP